MLSWELPEADYRALSRLPCQANAVQIAASNSPTGVLFAAEA